MQGCVGLVHGMRQDAVRHPKIDKEMTGAVMSVRSAYGCPAGIVKRNGLSASGRSITNLAMCQDGKFSSSEQRGSVECACCSTAKPRSLLVLPSSSAKVMKHAVPDRVLVDVRQCRAEMYTTGCGSTWGSSSAVTAGAWWLWSTTDHLKTRAPTKNIGGRSAGN